MKGLKEGELNGYDGVPEAPVPPPHRNLREGGFGFYFPAAFILSMAASVMAFATFL